MELSMFRQRSTEAIKQKARRGELIRTVAVGYLKTDDDRIEKDADRRVQDTIALVFHKFVELQSVRQVLVWMRQDRSCYLLSYTPMASNQSSGRHPCIALSTTS